MDHPLDHLHHVTINVADLQRAIRWYTTSARCEVVQQESTFAVLRFANILLTLSLPSQGRPHIAVVRTDAAEFGELMENSDGTRSTFVADPTGNLVEIVEGKQ